MSVFDILLQTFQLLASNIACVAGGFVCTGNGRNGVEVVSLASLLPSLFNPARTKPPATQATSNTEQHFPMSFFSSQ